MAYVSENMRLMGGVPSQQLFIYRTEDAVADVTASGYFNEAAEDYNLDTGDIIISCTGADMAAAVDMMVATNTGGTVTVVSGT
ncbi:MULTISPECIES: hypothetical protein [unclassified Pseudodesulfovibrio]|uniref:hypothetical protein n=1 Tax=unclassified Pseudodesulfovibrio TaxID=2661612 RepID=UPI000FEB781F|nr:MULTISPECIES: hypothetical protein [unclassified Pseudodesulfovibrio]MCJ2165968.1 hypothetical protein [Pseudodesulfovibrio sp. S3-i]RWU02594.1 hypothetical protein DWB63_15545 [Pseudodesulfovibrio sp. S3]